MAQENQEDLICLVKEAAGTEDNGDGVHNSVHVFLEVLGVWPHTCNGVSSQWRNANKLTMNRNLVRGSAHCVTIKAVCP